MFNTRVLLPISGVLTTKEEFQEGMQYLKRECKTELDFAVFTTFFSFNT